MLRSRVKLSCNGLLLCTHSISFKTAKHDPEIKKRDKILSGGGGYNFHDFDCCEEAKNN